MGLIKAILRKCVGHVRGMALRVCLADRFGYSKFEKRAPDAQLIGD